MTTQPGANLYTQGFGSRPESVEVPVITNVAPSAINVNGFPIGKRWINTSTNTEYALTSISSSGGVTTGTWTLLGAGSGDLNTLTTQDSVVVSPSAGNINIIGSNTLTTTGSGHTVTINPSKSGFPITPFVVGPSGQAGYQTIQSAVTAAYAAGGGIVYVQPGTYTENVTMKENVDLVAIVGTSGNAVLTGVGGEEPSVEIVGNFTLDVTAAASTPTTEIKSIKFTVTSGDLFHYVGNIVLLESGYLTFVGCYLEAGTGSNAIFKIDGFFNINLLECVIDEVTVNTNTLLTFGATPFLNLNCRNSVVEINGQNACTLPATSFITIALENTFYTARMDLSGVIASLSLDATNSFFNFNGGTPGNALIEFGSNDSHANAQNCIIENASGSLANSTAVDASASFRYTGCTFNNPLVLGSTGRGDFTFCKIFGGTSPAVTMSSSQNVSFTSCAFSSSNNPCIAGSGAGTITFGDISFVSNSAIAGTLTVAWIPTKTGVLTATGNITASGGQLFAGGDAAGVASTTSITNTNSTTISTGNGTVKMSSANPGTNAAWIKIYVGTSAYWIPAWTTNAP